MSIWMSSVFDVMLNENMSYCIWYDAISYVVFTELVSGFYVIWAGISTLRNGLENVVLKSGLKFGKI